MNSKFSLPAATLAGPIAALLALTLATGSALAVDGVWVTNAGGGNWDDLGKWVSDSIPGGVGATADFQVSRTSGNINVALNGDRTIGILKIGFFGDGRGLTLTASGKLILDNGASDALINFRDGGGNMSINPSATELKSNLLINNLDDGGNKGFFFTSGLSSTNGHLTITNTSHLNSRTKFNGVVSDGAAGNSITYNQTAGWSEFTNNNNTFSGTTTNGGGLLHLGNTAGISLALQNSALDTTASITGTATAGLRLFAGISSLTLGGLVGSKNFNSTGTGVFSTATSNYNLVTALTLNPGTGKNHSYSGAIENGAAAMTLTKTGAGTQVLSGTNTYTGATTISAGTLSVGVTANLGDAAANLVFNGGTLQITGTTLANFSGIGHTVSFNAGQTVGLDVNNAAHIFDVDQVLNQTTGGFTKLGAGTADLNLNNTYTGATNVNAGTLNVNGTLGAGANAVNVNAGAKLKFGSVSQTLGSLSIGAGATVTFTSGVASGAFSGGGKAAGFGTAASSFGPGASGSAVVPEPGTLGLLLAGVLGVLGRRRRHA